ncbi:hypothetical protein ASJ79_22710 [Mycobacterium sp. NAZ190054]|nr:hypothetical protein ASJ79_22710 [Mycobacterium sp. NAZ190054]
MGRVKSNGSQEPSTETAKSDVVLERRLAVSRGPIGDIAASQRTVVMANPGDDSVSLVDNTTLTVVGTVAVDGEPTAVAVSEDRAFVSVAADSFDAVKVIDLETRAVVATYPVAFGVTALAADPDGKRVYAGRGAHDRIDVAVIDVTAERVGTIGIGSGPAANVDALAADPDGKRLYAAVTDAAGSRLIVVDTETSLVHRVVPIGAPIRDIAYAGGAVYVLTSDRVVGGAVHVLDLATMRVTDRVTLGGAPTQMTMSADQTRAYIVDYDRVAVLCTLSLDVVDALAVDARPSCVTQGADSSRMYVADYSGAVSVFSVESSIETLYSQFLATEPMAVGGPRALQPTPA